MERIKTDQEIDATCYFLPSQKPILALQQGYFPDLKRLTQSVFRFSRDNYTPALSINSPPEAYPRKRREERTRRCINTRTERETAKQRLILLLSRIQKIQRTASLIRVLIP